MAGPVPIELLGCCVALGLAASAVPATSRGWVGWGGGCAHALSGSAVRAPKLLPYGQAVRVCAHSGVSGAAALARHVDARMTRAKGVRGGPGVGCGRLFKEAAH